jgi:plasmid stabilization system protein ParE
MTRVEFHPDAVAEAHSAWQWYAERSPLAAAAFLSELDRAIALVSKGPYQWPQYVAGTRRYALRRFPYVLVYRERGDSVQIIAVAHGRRRPGYWRHR